MNRFPAPIVINRSRDLGHTVVVQDMIDPRDISNAPDPGREVNRDPNTLLPNGPDYRNVSQEPRRLFLSQIMITGDNWIEGPMPRITDIVPRQTVPQQQGRMPDWFDGDLTGLQDFGGS